MLSVNTRFPEVGSFADLAITVPGPRGGKAGTVTRRVRIIQHCADGRYLVTADATHKRIGNRMVPVSSLSKTVERSELREVRQNG